MAGSRERRAPGRGGTQPNIGSRGREDSRQTPPAKKVEHKVREQWEKDMQEASCLNWDEFDLTCNLFNQRLVASKELTVDGEADKRDWLTIEDVDVVLRKLRIFPSVRLLWALFLETDENCNGQVELDEFLTMVAKLKDRQPLSPDFYRRSLPRTESDHFTKVFEILDADADGMLDRDELITALRQLNNAVDLDAEYLRTQIQKADTGGTGRFKLDDFLALQARLRKAPPEVEVALMSLSEEELDRFTKSFQDWRGQSESPTPPTCSEIRRILADSGFPAPAERVKFWMNELSLDGSRDMEVRDLLFMLVSLGAGKEVRPRRLLLPNACYEDAFRVGLPLEELWDLGYDDIQKLRKAGWAAATVRRAGFATVLQLRRAGYSAVELRRSGAKAKELKLAGFSLEELRRAGYSTEVLRHVCVSLGTQVVDPHRRPEDEIVLKPLPSDFVEGGPGDERYSDNRWWSTPRIQAVLDGSARSRTSSFRLA